VLSAGIGKFEPRKEMRANRREEGVAQASTYEKGEWSGPEKIYPDKAKHQTPTRFCGEKGQRGISKQEGRFFEGGGSKRVLLISILKT